MSVKVWLRVMLGYCASLAITVTVCLPTFDAVVAFTVITPVKSTFNSVVVKFVTPLSAESLTE